VSRRSDATVLFTAFIPQQIDPSWHPEWGPKLSGFPLNIRYVKGRNTSNAPPQAVTYWFDPGTFREDSDHREMCYFTKQRNGHHVRVIYNKDRGNWQTEKFRGDKRICLAAGPTFDKAMLQTTMVGAESDE
jgi:hypothetical protein